MEPKIKKVKTGENSNENKINPPAKCKHFVIRKKRFCKMTVAKGKEYCGEHSISETSSKNENNSMERISCPLDVKHTVYKKYLKKHLRICNSRPKENPKYIVPGINAGSDEDKINKDNNLENIKLSDTNEETLNNLIKKIKIIYEKYIKCHINDLILEHNIMNDELNNKEYGKETRKHLIQTSSILGYLNHFNVLKNDTAYIEFGAGKGQVSYWLAQAIQNEKNTKVILIDRASHRHKKDNKIEDKNFIHRIRADISDFDMRNFDLINDCSNVVAVSKHLCGAATDLALRCLLLKKEVIKCFIIAFCCHHRCEWKSFVGKEFFTENDLTKYDFMIMIKMVGWAVCGDGYSREKRKEITENQKQHLVELENSKKEEIVSDTGKLCREQKEEIGFMCKRIIDYSRLRFMENNGFECNLKYYVDSNITLENVCLLGFIKNKNIN